MANNKYQKRISELNIDQKAGFAVAERSKVASCVSKYFHGDESCTKRFKVTINKELNITQVERIK